MVRQKVCWVHLGGQMPSYSLSESLGKPQQPIRWVILPEATGMAEMRGFSYTFGDTTFIMTAGGYNYTFTMTPTPQVPTTYGSITAGVGTFATW